MSKSQEALTLRRGELEVRIDNPVDKVEWYMGSTDGRPNVKHGPTYYRVPSSTDPDEITVADIGFATLLDGRPSADAAQSIAEQRVPIGAVPHGPLKGLRPNELNLIAEKTVELCGLHGWGSAVSTKVLHKKRPAAVPVLDSKAIFGSYLDPTWVPGTDPNTRYPLCTASRFLEAIQSIQYDLARSENELAWRQVAQANPGLKQVELFDMVWWAYIHHAP